MSSINKGKNMGGKANLSAEEVEEIISYQDNASNHFVESRSSDELKSS